MSDNTYLVHAQTSSLPDAPYDSGLAFGSSCGALQACITAVSKICCFKK